MKKSLHCFIKKKCRKQIKKKIRIEKVIKRKWKKYLSNGTTMIIHLTAGLIKKTFYKMIQYFPKPYDRFGGDMNIKLIYVTLQQKKM